MLGERGVDEARPTSGGRVQEGRKEGDSTLFALRKREIKRGLECETRWVTTPRPKTSAYKWQMRSYRSLKLFESISAAKMSSFREM